MPEFIGKTPRAADPYEVKRNMRRPRLLWSLFLSFACTLCLISCAKPKEPEYKPEEKIQYAIAKIIADNKISGCAEFTWQQPGSIPFEYLVQCSNDGFRWTPYFVRTKRGTIEKGVGPAY